MIQLNLVFHILVQLEFHLILEYQRVLPYLLVYLHLYLNHPSETIDDLREFLNHGQLQYLSITNQSINYSTRVNTPSCSRTSLLSSLALSPIEARVKESSAEPGQLDVFEGEKVRVLATRLVNYTYFITVFNYNTEEHMLIVIGYEEPEEV